MIFLNWLVINWGSQNFPGLNHNKQENLYIKNVGKKLQQHMENLKWNYCFLTCFFSLAICLLSLYFTSTNYDAHVFLTQDVQHFFPKKKKVNYHF